MGKIAIVPYDGSMYDELVRIRYEWARTLYAGYVSRDIMRGFTPESVRPHLDWCIASPNVQVRMAMDEEKPVGYIAWADSQREPGSGVILSAAFLPNCNTQVPYELVRVGTEEMLTSGHAKAYAWVLKDNYRVRYLLEHMGYRCEQITQDDHQEEFDFTRIRYVYLPQKPY